MEYLLNNEILDAVIKEAKESTTCINFITAYCKLTTLEKIDNYIGNNVSKRILVRFLPSDISSGATDKEIYDYCIKNNWEIYYDFSIHAKIFIFDKIKAIWGSANVTNNGMGLSKNANKELSSYGELDDEEYCKIITLYKDANKLDKSSFDYIVNHQSDDEVIKYSNLKENYKKIECLMPEDFPDESTDIIELYSLRSFKWLINFLKNKSNNISYFGEISEKIHNIFAQNPKQFRKDIKKHVSDLLSCIKRLSVKGIKITKPNFSECVFLDENVYNDN